MNSSSSLSPGPALVDAHVHLYPRFDLIRFLECGIANIRRGASELGLSTTAFGWLLLAETNGCDAFRMLADQASGRDWNGLRIRETAERCSLIAQAKGEDAIGIIAGRQIVTREKLEVLALGTDGRFPDGESLDQTLGRLRDADAIPVLPWGFGKWSFRRGALVERTLRSARRNEIFVGDNGGRLACRPRPRLLALAEDLGLVVLPGSDPLPLSHEEDRVAGFGFVLEAPVDAERPTESLKARLRALTASPRPYGRLAAAVPFARKQIAMQMRRLGVPG